VHSPRQLSLVVDPSICAVSRKLLQSSEVLTTRQSLPLLRAPLRHTEIGWLCFTGGGKSPFLPKSQADCKNLFVTDLRWRVRNDWHDFSANWMSVNSVETTPFDLPLFPIRPLCVNAIQGAQGSSNRQSLLDLGCSVNIASKD